jgi:hypothetical protein
MAWSFDLFLFYFISFPQSMGSVAGSWEGGGGHSWAGWCAVVFIFIF